MTADGEPRAIVTSVDATGEQSGSENKGACGKVKRQRMGHIAEKGFLGSCRCGSIHEPVVIQEVLKKPEAKAAVDKEL